MNSSSASCALLLLLLTAAPLLALLQAPLPKLPEQALLPRMNILRDLIRTHGKHSKCKDNWDDCHLKKEKCYSETVKYNCLVTCNECHNTVDGVWCKDSHPQYCEELKGDCGNELATNLCQRTCQACEKVAVDGNGNTTGIASTSGAPIIPECMDYMDDCAKKVKECYLSHVKFMCLKTCLECNSGKDVLDDGIAEECKDKATTRMCKKWDSGGRSCEEGSMKALCRKFCSLCKGEDRCTKKNPPGYWVKDSEGSKDKSLICGTGADLINDVSGIDEVCCQNHVDEARAMTDNHEMKQLKNTQQEIEAIYKEATLCPYQNSTATNNQEKLICNIKRTAIDRIMEKSEDYDELAYYWKNYRDKATKPYRKHYAKLVKYSNDRATQAGSDNFWQMKIHQDNDIDILQYVPSLWKDLRPFYLQIHAYVREKLRNIYGPSKIGYRSPIPAHLFGNLFAHQLHLKHQLFTPYHQNAPIDVTEDLKKQKYSLKKMYRIAEKFFVGLNFTKFDENFWKYSIFQLPEEIRYCMPSAYGFHDHKNFRLGSCGSIGMSSLIYFHYHFCTLIYMREYQNQPHPFRKPASTAIKDALAEMVTLSIAPPKHLHKIGLSENNVDSKERDINFLMKQALEKIVFMPYSYVLAKWRMDVFSGEVKEENWNCHWWELRLTKQGIKPPSLRTEKDFDAGAKDNIPGNKPYIQYFIGSVITYQIHRKLCKEAGQYDPEDKKKPLYKCDISNSTEAGNIIKKAMQKGRSERWLNVLKELSGDGQLDPTAILAYYKPLSDWLKEHNEQTEEYIGWDNDEEVYCGSETPKFTGPDHKHVHLHFHGPQCNKSISLDNLSNKTRDHMERLLAKMNTWD